MVSWRTPNNLFSWKSPNQTTDLLSLHYKKKKSFHISLTRINLTCTTTQVNAQESMRLKYYKIGIKPNHFNSHIQKKESQYPTASRLTPHPLRTYPAYDNPLEQFYFYSSSLLSSLLFITTIYKFRSLHRQLPFFTLPLSKEENGLLVLLPIYRTSDGVFLFFTHFLSLVFFFYNFFFCGALPLLHDNTGKSHRHNGLSPSNLHLGKVSYDYQKGCQHMFKTVK